MTAMHTPRHHWRRSTHDSGRVRKAVSTRQDEPRSRRTADFRPHSAGHDCDVPILRRGVRGSMRLGRGTADDVRRLDELLGVAHYLREHGLLAQAEEEYTRAFGIAGQLAMLPQQAESARGIALTARADDRPVTALEWFDAALAIASATDWPEWVWQ